MSLIPASTAAVKSSSIFVCRAASMVTSTISLRLQIFFISSEAPGPPSASCWLTPLSPESSDSWIGYINLNQEFGRVLHRCRLSNSRQSHQSVHLLAELLLRLAHFLHASRAIRLSVSGHYRLFYRRLTSGKVLSRLILSCLRILT